MKQEAEEWFGDKSEFIQVVFGDPGRFIDECDSKSGWEKSSLISLRTTGQKQGVACLEYVGEESTEFKKKYSIPYTPEVPIEKATIEFWYYVSDVSLHESSNQVEVGSAGINDQDEYAWKLTELTNGWNYISLDFNDARIMGNPDYNAINWFRIYHRKTGPITTRLDAIRIVDKNYTSIVKHEVKQSLKVYPNPLNSSSLFIELEGFERPEIADISLINLSGQTVYQGEMNSNETIVINTNSLLCSSVYFVTVKSEKYMMTTRIMVN